MLFSVISNPCNIWSIRRGQSRCKEGRAKEGPSSNFPQGFAPFTSPENSKGEASIAFFEGSFPYIASYPPPLSAKKAKVVKKKNDRETQFNNNATLIVDHY